LFSRPVAAAVFAQIVAADTRLYEWQGRMEPIGRAAAQ
jgi:hypothetical protein